MEDITAPCPDWLVDPDVPLRARAVLAIIERYAGDDGIDLYTLGQLVGGPQNARREAIREAARSGYVEALQEQRPDSRFAPVRYRVHPEGEMVAPPQGKSTRLYRHFDGNGMLLYVGICFSSSAREKRHARHSVWHCLSAQRAEVVFPNRKEAEDAEMDAIATEFPLFNFPVVDQEANLGRTRRYLEGCGRMDLWPGFLRGTSAEHLLTA